MSVVVADTGPIRYLLAIGEIQLLPALFGEVTIPVVVRAELMHRSAPKVVQAWAGSPPEWLRVLAPPDSTGSWPNLDAGERSALELAIWLRAELILIDDRAGTTAARSAGIETTGTLGILARAAQRGLVDFDACLSKLKATGFYWSQDVVTAVLKAYRT